MSGWGGFARRSSLRLLAATVVMSLVAVFPTLTGGEGSSHAAAAPAPFTPEAPPPGTPPVPGTDAPRARPAFKSLASSPAPKKPVWPEGPLDHSAPKGPVRLTMSAGSSPSQVKVTAVDRVTTGALGVRGLVLKVDSDGRSARTRVAISYGSFAQAYGGDWSSRLRLVALPSCALKTPRAPACQTQTPVASTNNVAEQTVTADVRLVNATTAFALVAGASGSEGTYAATPLQPSGSWTGGGSSGTFSWSLPFLLPPSAAGPAPSASLGYSSASVDGRQTATNAQSSVVGEGWDLTTGGFIERAYVACAKDRVGSNTTQVTGDLCWDSDNATIWLNGQARLLVRDDTSGTWRVSGNDGTRIERATGAVNGDNDGEHWIVRTTDGTAYFFGKNRLPNWATGDPVTQSVFGVPVYGNQPGEPCYTTSFASSRCTQAWRWNLDYVVDVHGNATSFYYQPEVNYYRANLQTPVSYQRGGWLARVEYGQYSSTINTTFAPQRVLFTMAERCLPTSTFDCATTKFTTANAQYWPDTPVDLACSSGDACLGRLSPTFWTRKRLSMVETQVADSAGVYKPVDRWTLKHTFPNSGDGTNPVLWLSSVQRTGLAGGTLTVPAVRFSGVQLANRVDTTADGRPAMFRYRVNTIYNEVGGVIGVDYTPAECSPTNKPTADDANVKRCYPVWGSFGGTRVKEYFHRYLVAKVYEQDPTGGGTTAVTSYEYSGGPAWAYNRTPNVPSIDRTWSDFRGYGKVVTRTGVTPDPVSRTETTYFRGMHGDKTTTGTRSVEVLDSDGVAVADYLEFAGIPRETTSFNGATFVASTINTPWRGPLMATQTRPGTTPLESRAVQIGQSSTKVALADGSMRRTKLVDTYNSDGQLVEQSDLGDTAIPDDEQCTTLSFAPSAANGPLYLVAHTLKVAASCNQAPSLPGDLVEETKVFYDGHSDDLAVVTRGNPTREDRVTSWPEGGQRQWTTVSTAQYDSRGVKVRQADAKNSASTTSYKEHYPGGPISQVVVTNPLGHTQTSLVDLFRGSTLAVIDANGRRTDIQYDALGRVAKAWEPGRVKATQVPTAEFTYTLDATKPMSVVTTLRDPDGYARTSTMIYDGLMRKRQAQGFSAQGGRVVQDWFYDSRNQVIKQYHPYVATGAPSATLFLAAGDNVIPSMSRMTYDAMGRVLTERFQGYNVDKWQTSYIHQGDTLTTIPPVGGVKTATVTDAQGKIIERRRWLTASTYDTTKYSYDKLGRLVSVTDPAGARWTYGYDLLGRRDEVIDPDTGRSTVTYDALNLPVTTTNSLGDTVASTYDALGRITTTHDDSATGAKRTEFVYDTLAKGLITSSTRYVDGQAYSTSVTGYNTQYKPLGRNYVIPAAEGALAGTYTYTNTYNTVGDLEFVRMPAAGGLRAETIEYDYDRDRNIAAITGYGSQPLISSINYDTFGSPTRIATGSAKGLYVTNIYDATTRRLSRSIVDRSVAPTRIDDRTYGYDAAGNVLWTKSETPNALEKDLQCYQYDALRRLKTAWTATSDCTTGPSVTGEGATVGGVEPYWRDYTFDARGNRVSVVEHGVTPAEPTITAGYEYPGTVTDQPHTLLTVTTPAGTTASFTYDAAGRQTSRTQGALTVAQTWDREGHLTAVTTGGATTEYLYDAAGARLVEKEPTRTTVYLGDHTQLVLDKTTNTVTATRKVSAPGVNVTRTTGMALTYEVTDPQGTGSWKLDAATLTPTRRLMAPFGTPRGTQPPWPNDRNYVGGTKDATGLVHLGAREYDPTFGRFISPDPLIDLLDPEQMNGYSYANNSPITNSDPDGLICAAVSMAGGGDAGGCAGGTAHRGGSGGSGDANAPTCRSSNTCAQVGGVHDFLAGLGTSLNAVTKAVVPFVVNVAVTSGCLAATAGAGSLGCVVAGGIAGGAAHAKMTCNGDAMCWAQDIATNAAANAAGFAVGKAAAPALGKLPKPGAPATRTAPGPIAANTADATSSIAGRDLSRRLASEQQMAEVGRPLAGAGTGTKLRAAERLADDYGGDPADWAKMGSSSYRGADGFQFETHWYENVFTRNQVEVKVKTQWLP